jgi:hypothetical protein
MDTLCGTKLAWHFSRIDRLPDPKVDGKSHIRVRMRDRWRDP